MQCRTTRRATDRLDLEVAGTEWMGTTQDRSSWHVMGSLLCPAEDVYDDDKRQRQIQGFQNIFSMSK